ncbi:MAG: tRNA 2-selenouridine(34) synthase MnmH [Bacteroidota bacterium]
MIQTLPIETFLVQQAAGQPAFDVRAPKEFAKGHIPHAINLPLFTDAERAEVGTLYKQQGRDQAVLKGLDLVGPKMGELVRAVQNQASGKRILLHCWRGGMRSESVAWLLDKAGFEVSVLAGGYKNFRQNCHDIFAQKWPLIVVGGKSGSGKTDILKALAAKGEQIIDLEAIARHKGSAFGGLGHQPQPQVEQFENDLAQALRPLDPNRRIWVEDESHAIGRVYIPDAFWTQMKAAPLIDVTIPDAARINRLIDEYAIFPPEKLAESIDRIRKRLGGQHHQRAQLALSNGNFALVAQITLKYYDKAYTFGLQKKAQSASVYHLCFDQDDPQYAAEELMAFCTNERIAT